MRRGWGGRIEGERVSGAGRIEAERMSWAGRIEAERMSWPGPGRLGAGWPRPPE
jgi:hypothetical protein